MDEFNLALVQQIAPHFESLGLKDELLKFTGDGWLVVTEKSDLVEALCCLAMVMTHCFQREMSEKIGKPLDEIPAVRAAICAGRDVRVELPMGGNDFVGDSVRCAVRASNVRAEACANEILIDHSVHRMVCRNFNCEELSAAELREPKPGEEQLSLFVVGDLRSDAGSDSRAPDCYVYTLDQLGRGEEATEAARRSADRLATEIRTAGEIKPADDEQRLRSWNKQINRAMSHRTAIELLERMRQEGVTPDVVTYNTLVNLAPDYDMAKGWVETMRRENVTPNVVTYNTLVNLAPDYEVAKGWVETMRRENVTPDVVTYNTLVNLAPDYEVAKGWVETMRRENVTPNVVTYSTLVNLAPDYDMAKGWLETMRRENVTPDVVTYNTLVNLAPDYDMAKGWVETMRRENVTPNVVTYNTLVNLAPDYDMAKGWVETMRRENVTPNVVTYNTLVNLAPDYEVAKGWVETMRRENVTPDVVTYSTLVNLAPDYEVAKGWVETMRREGVTPDVVTCISLFAKDLSGVQVADLLVWYRRHGIAHEEPIQAAIVSYRRHGHITESLVLAMHYPHLQSARRMIKRHHKHAIIQFEKVAEQGGENCEAACALGLAYLCDGAKAKGRASFKRALRLSRTQWQKTLIREWLEQANE